MDEPSPRPSDAGPTRDPIPPRTARDVASLIAMILVFGTAAITFILLPFAFFGLRPPRVVGQVLIATFVLGLVAAIISTLLPPSPAEEDQSTTAPRRKTVSPCPGCGARRPPTSEGTCSYCGAHLPGV